MANGARFLKRVIDERIKLPLSQQWKEASGFRAVDGGRGHRRGADDAAAGEDERLRNSDRRGCAYAIGPSNGRAGLSGYRGSPVACFVRDADTTFLTSCAVRGRRVVALRTARW